MRAANPALSAKSFTGVGRTMDTAHAMSIKGTLNKTALFAALTLIAASYTRRKSLNCLGSLRRGLMDNRKRH
jgi:hypothetical protein